ncbi:MAG: AbrB/MazE/SpoVT family DNA-binding domain-containing protein [Chloroflexota bacterium]|nr:AbrB/MazE/SpoVT family DNA-binding domain-containing protein [Chloroflexota bacterium]MDE2960468.1 AbrB/MazE/SpoVT family DNA-binding domain-containing protein [Chloroflexota bacterium]
MNESRITAKGQTTLPKAVREALFLHAGDRVRYFVHDGEVRIRKVLPISRLYGALPYDGPPVSVEEMQQAIIAGATDS